MKKLVYEVCALAIGFPLIMWLVVAPMLTAASTLLNLIAMVIVVITLVEFVSLGSRIINKLSERIEN